MQILDLPIPLTVLKETHRFYFVIPFKKIKTPMSFLSHSAFALYV